MTGPTDSKRVFDNAETFVMVVGHFPSASEDVDARDISIFLARHPSQADADWAYLVGVIAKERDDALAQLAAIRAEAGGLDVERLVDAIEAAEKATGWDLNVGEGPLAEAIAAEYARLGGER